MTRVTFTGRLVQGDVYEAKVKTDKRTKQPKIGQNGEPIKQVFAALAIPKDPASRLTIPGNPTYEEQKALVDGAARAAWPQFFTGQRQQGMMYPASLPHDCTLPKFALKVVDGDGFDDNGQPNSAKEGWAGCWVVKFSNGFVPKVYEWTASGWQETIHTGRKVKCGDYVSISGTYVTNQSTESPGMYMNFDTVSFEQEGAFIAAASSVDPNQALGQRGTPASPPAHAAAGTPPPPGNAGAASTGAPAHGGQGSTTAPAYSGYRDAGAAGAPPPPGAAATPPPPPAGPQMTAAATTTYEAYKAAGWSDDQLRAGGLMV